MIGLLRGRGPELGRYGAAYPQAERTMLHVLRDRAALHPDRTWAVFDGPTGGPVELTYGAALRQVHRFGRAVLEDFGPGRRIGLFLRNQIEFLPTLYGTMAAAGVAVPLNADAKGFLLQRVVEHAELKVIVSRGDVLPILEALDGLGAVELILVAEPVPDPLPVSIHGIRVATIESWLTGREVSGRGLSGRSEAADCPLPNSADVAMIQYTSGTTGNSKGVVYSHHFFYLYSAIVSDAQHHDENTVLSTPLPLFHVAALHIVANSALHCGGRAILKSRFSARSYWNEIAADGATFAILLGPLAAILMRTAGDPPPHRLRKLFCLPFPPDGDAFERRFGVRILWQGYGMTEVYPAPMHEQMIPDVPYDTVGHIAAWMEYGVVDENDRLLPPGEPGELVFHSTLVDGMAREYFRDPEATATAFRGGMFHTGDVAFVDDIGLVHFRGRMQDRIRRRGENISAAELELIAMSHPSILEAAAFGVPGEFGEHEVKLDVVAVDRELDLVAYHEWLEQHLPRFMVPRYLELRDELPKSPSAKIQKHLLASSSLDRAGVLVFEPPARLG